MGYNKNKEKVEPSMTTEVSFLTANLFLLKFYSLEMYTLISYFMCFIPLLAYCIALLFGKLMKFI